jgi:hypothetical protein
MARGWLDMYALCPVCPNSLPCAVLLRCMHVPRKSECVCASQCWCRNEGWDLRTLPQRGHEPSTINFPSSFSNASSALGALGGTATQDVCCRKPALLMHVMSVMHPCRYAALLMHAPAPPPPPYTHTHARREMGSLLPVALRVTLRALGTFSASGSSSRGSGLTLAFFFFADLGLGGGSTVCLMAAIMPGKPSEASSARLRCMLRGKGKGSTACDRAVNWVIWWTQWLHGMQLSLTLYIATYILSLSSS